MEQDKHPTFGNGKICYIEIPSGDVLQSSSFYHKVFGWRLRTRSDGSVAFDDGVGEVSGTFRTDRNPVGSPGMLVHVMVDDIQDTIRKIVENGGRITQAVGHDAPEITAWFTDPSGNTMGLFQQ